MKCLSICEFSVVVFSEYNNLSSCSFLQILTEEESNASEVWAR